MKLWKVAFVVFAVVFFFSLSPFAPAAEPETRLDAILREWAEKRRGIKDFRCQVKRTTWNRTFGTKKFAFIEVAGIQPDLLRLNWKDDKGHATDSFLITSETLYWHQLEGNKAFEVRLSKAQRAQIEKSFETKGWLERAFLTLLCTLRAQEDLFMPPVESLKTRFTVQLHKETEGWAWLNLRPRSGIDRRQMEQIQVVLETKSGVVWHVQLLEANGDKVLYTTIRIETNLKPALSPESLAEGLPKNWTKVEPTKPVTAVPVNPEKDQAEKN